MVEFPRQAVKRPLENNISAVERIRALDLFTLNEERQLHNTRILLLAAIAAACPVNQTPRSMASNVPAAESNHPATSIPTGMLSPDELEGQRATKRQTLFRVGANDTYGGTFTAYSAPLAGVQQPVANPPATALVFAPYGIPAVSSQVRYPYGDPNIGPMSSAAEVFSQPAYPPHHLANPAPPTIYSGLGQPLTSHQVPTDSVLPPSGPPSEAANYSTHVHPQALDWSGVAGPTSVSSSTNLSSHQHALYDNVSVSGHSHANLSSNVKAPPSQIWAQVPTTTSNPVLSAWLRDNPFTIPHSELVSKLADVRYGDGRTNWEKEFIIFFWVGPQAPPRLVLTAMASHKSPTLTQEFSPEWETLSSQWFRNSRSPGTLVQYWWILEEIYCLILFLFATTNEEPAGAIIIRIHQSIRDTTSLSAAQTSLIKTQDLAAWVERGQDSWFVWMHKRYEYTFNISQADPTFDRLSNHPEVTERVKELQVKQSTGATRSIPRGSSKRKAPKQRNQGGSAVSATPPPPSAPRLARQPSQPSRTSSHVDNDPATGHVVTFTPNFPGWLEALKGHDVATQTTVDVSHAKIAYLQTSADAARVSIAQGIAAIETNELDLRRRAARDVLNDPTSDPDLRKTAQDTYASILDPHRPSMINPREFVGYLRQALPDVGNTASGDIEDPAHPTNIVDFVDSAEFETLFRASGIAGPFNAASSSSAAGSFSAAGPSSVAGPSNITGPSSVAGPSSAAGPSSVAGVM